MKKSDTPIRPRGLNQNAVERFLTRQTPHDAAHDLAHVRRVVRLATRLAREEGANLDVVLPAAWLHDCVSLPKNHPERASASRRAASAAVAFLREEGYPEHHLDAVAHAVEAHSFSAGIAPRTLEAKVVQDADRLDALGAVGLARMLAVGAALGTPLYHPDEPIPTTRPPDDRAWTLDHIYTKLVRLGETMHTSAARREAKQRTDFLLAFADRLADEVGG